MVEVVCDWALIERHESGYRVKSFVSSSMPTNWYFSGNQVNYFNPISGDWNDQSLYRVVVPGNFSKFQGKGYYRIKLQCKLSSFPQERGGKEAFEVVPVSLEILSFDAKRTADV